MLSGSTAASTAAWMLAKAPAGPTVSTFPGGVEDQGVAEASAPGMGCTTPWVSSSERR